MSICLSLCISPCLSMCPCLLRSLVIFLMFFFIKFAQVKHGRDQCIVRTPDGTDVQTSHESTSASASAPSRTRAPITLSIFLLQSLSSCSNHYLPAPITIYLPAPITIFLLQSLSSCSNHSLSSFLSYLLFSSVLFCNFYLSMKADFDSLSLSSSSSLSSSCLLSF